MEFNVANFLNIITNIDLNDSTTKIRIESRKYLILDVLGTIQMPDILWNNSFCCLDFIAVLALLHTHYVPTNIILIFLRNQRKRTN